MAQTTIQGSFLGDGTVTGVKIGADFISAQTALASPDLVSTDEILVSDAGVIKRMDISVLEIAATQITASGTLPALNGSNLTALSAANITASGTLPALNGAALTALNADNIGSGTVPVARLGDGNESNSTFLRGDNTWVAVSGTTINTNADNRVITGSGTANTLNGEANLTFDGSTLTTLNTDIVLSDAQGLSWKRESDSLVRNMIKTTLYSGGVYHIDIGHESSNFRDIRFIADGASAAPYMTIKALTGNIEVAAGNVVIGTAGKGIDFSNQADQATGETMSSELLDFYEEGSFVPRISMYNNIGSSTASHAATTKGTYVRIGKMCYFQIYLMLDHSAGGLGSESGDALITPLPFTASDREIAINVGYFDSMGITAGQDVGGYINASTTRIRLRLSDHANGQSNLQMSEFSSDGQIYLNGCYEVA